MKVIFLDIDGVLNCTKTPNPRKFPYIVDRRLLRRFERLVARTKAKVVLSSTWRYDPAGLFSARHWGIRFIDVIPDLSEAAPALRAPGGAHQGKGRSVVDLALRSGRPLQRPALGHPLHRCDPGSIGGCSGASSAWWRAPRQRSFCRRPGVTIRPASSAPGIGASASSM